MMLGNPPTYDRELIKADPIWDLAFTMSEIMNDNAPIGWHKYIGAAECLLASYDIKRKEKSNV
jgi:hypothetical protein